MILAFWHIQTFAFDVQEALSFQNQQIQYYCQEDDKLLNTTAIEHKQFLDISEKNINLGFWPYPCWFKFNLENKQSLFEQQLVLEVPFAHLDTIELFTLDSFNRLLSVKKSGDNESYQQRDIKIRYTAFDIAIPPQQNYTFYLKVSTVSPMIVPLSFKSQDVFWQDYSTFNIFLGLLFGIEVGLLLYHIVLWFVNKQKKQILYSVYSVSTAFLFLSLYGFLYFILPSGAWWNSQSFHAIIFWVSASLLLFVREFLDHSMTKMMKIYQTAIYFSIFCLLMVSVLPIALVAKMLPIAASIICVLGGFVVIYNIVNSKIIVKSLLISVFFPFVAIIFSLIMIFIEKGNFLLSIYAFHICVVGQKLWFAVDLAKYINVLQNEKEIIQQKILVVEAENQAKNQFIARMSHEIRTPLNVILGMAYLLTKKEHLNGHDKYQINLIREAGQNLLNTISRILDFSQSENTAIEIKKETVLIKEVIKDAVKIFEQAANRKNISVIIEISNDMPQQLLSDGLKIMQILEALLNNAIKFTEQGNIKITASIINKEVDNTCLELFVSDTGIGMTAEEQERVFVAFSQADESLSRRYGGIGLGLTMVHKLATAMGGSVSIDSVVQKGTRIGVKLPVIYQEQHEIETEEDIILDTSTCASTDLRVLVADDDELNQMVMEQLLSSVEIEDPVIVENGQQALDRLTAHHQDFDVVFMDFEMPVLGGLEAIRRLRAWEKQHLIKRPLYIIAATAHAVNYYKELGEEAGINDFLSKPIMIEEFTHSLEKAYAYIKKSVSNGGKQLLSS